METLDLINCIPEKMAEAASLDQLLHAASSIEIWEERHAEALDNIYRLKIIRLLTRRAPVDDLIFFSEHLENMLHPSGREALRHLERHYFERWSAYKDILESRLASMRNLGPGKVLKMTHVSQILDLVLSGRVTRQAEIQKILGLKKANLTRVLNIMEANGLIERRAEGREKLIGPGEMA